VVGWLVMYPLSFFRFALMIGHVYVGLLCCFWFDLRKTLHIVSYSRDRYE